MCDTPTPVCSDLLWPVILLLFWIHDILIEMLKILSRTPSVELTHTFLFSDLSQINKQHCDANVLKMWSAWNAYKERRGVPRGELHESVLHRLPDLQQEGLVLTQGVIPVLDVVSQSKLDHLEEEWSACKNINPEPFPLNMHKLSFSSFLLKHDLVSVFLIL